MIHRGGIFDSFHSLASSVSMSPKNGASVGSSNDLYGHLFPFGVDDRNNRFNFEFYSRQSNLMRPVNKEMAYLTGKSFEFRSIFSESE